MPENAYGKALRGWPTLISLPYQIVRKQTKNESSMLSSSKTEAIKLCEM